MRDKKIAGIWPLTWPHDLIHHFETLRIDFSNASKHKLSRNTTQTRGTSQQTEGPELLDYKCSIKKGKRRRRKKKGNTLHREMISIVQ